MMARTLLIMGFGGHARSVADVALACGYTALLFVDANAQDGEHFLGHPVHRQPPPLAAPQDAIAAVGNNLLRSHHCDAMVRLGLCLVTLVSPRASLGAGCQLGAGCFVGHHAHIGPMARVGPGCIVNTGAIVEHEAQVGHFSHVAVNASVAGRSTLGAWCTLGAGATLMDGLQVADGVTIGAGALVHRSIASPGTYAGVPARRLK